MTFPTELERLKKAMERGDIRVSECAEFFRNHADAILGLVRAADGHGCGWKIDDPRSNAPCPICLALAKLNGADK